MRLGSALPDSVGTHTLSPPKPPLLGAAQFVTCCRLQIVYHHQPVNMNKLKSKLQEGLTQLLSAACPQQQQQQQQQPAHSTYAPPVILSTIQQQQQQQCSAPPPKIHVIRCTCHRVSPIPFAESGGFAHPGILLGPGEVALLQQRASGAALAPDPFAAAAESLRADTPLTYTPHALADVHVEWYEGPKIGHKELVEQDGQMVYMQVSVIYPVGSLESVRQACYH